MKLTLRTPLISIISILMLSSVASAAAAETICNMQDDGGCRLTLPVSAASEYFDNSNPMISLVSRKGLTRPSSPQSDQPLHENENFDPRLVPKNEVKKYVARAVDSFNDRCKNTFKAYGKKRRRAHSR